LYNSATVRALVLLQRVMQVMDINAFLTVYDPVRHYIMFDIGII